MKIKNINVYGGQVNQADHIDKIEYTPQYSKEQFHNLLKLLALNEEQTQDIQTIYEEVDTLKLDEPKATVLLNELDKGYEAIKAELPALIVAKIEENKKLQTSMSFDGKFKTSIPIIPFILNYEMEAKNNLKDYFKKMWQDMKNGDVFLYKKK